MSACLHPKLMTLPVVPDRLFGIICTSCLKKASIGIGDYIGRNGEGEEFCLSIFIRDAFGDAWGQQVKKQCRCTQCKKEEEK